MPVLYNIFDSAEMKVLLPLSKRCLCRLGLYDRHILESREIVYILIAQRAARGLGSLICSCQYDDHGRSWGHSLRVYTPRGWMKTEKELLIFEQHLYLRQPGYGTSYITGKYLLEETLAEVAKMQEKRGEEFTLKQFFNTLTSLGNMPISLGRWELTGDSKPVRNITKSFRTL